MSQPARKLTDASYPQPMSLEDSGVHPRREEVAQLTTEWRDDGWVVVSRWYASTLASHWEQPLKKSQVFEVTDDDVEGWIFEGEGQRVTVDAADDGQSFSERWEVRDEDGTWRPLCDVTGSRER
jgi:hypothetical protein